MIYRYLNINELNIEEISKKVSKERIDRAAKLKHETDRKRSISVEYLLNEMIKETYPEIKTPVILSYDEKGKPHLNDDSIYFSLSHSGDYVACIISDKPCGIDIERHSDRREYEKIAKRICTDREILQIQNKEDFYSFWTLKESALKAVGLGLALDMKKAEFIPDTADSFSAYIDGTIYSGKVIESPEGYSLSYVEMMD